MESGKPFIDLVIDRASPVPAYYQLQEYVTERIDCGDLAPGDALPTERDLAGQLGLSRMTVRQALERLRVDGRLVRMRGAGTFVGAAPMGANDGLTSISALVAAQGRRSSTHLLDISQRVAPRSIAAALDLERGVKAIRIRRTRRVDGTPFSFETSWLGPSSCHVLLSTDLEDRSLIEALGTLCGIRLARASERLTVTTLDTFEATQLSAAEGAAAFRVNRTSWDADGTPVESVVSVIRGDRFVFTADLRAAVGAAPRPILADAK